MKRPSVLVVTRRTIRKNKFIDYVGEYHLALLIRLGILPVMVPVVEGAPTCLPQYMADMKLLRLLRLFLWICLTSNLRPPLGNCGPAIRRTILPNSRRVR